MTPLDHFIRDLDERKGKIPCCQEVTDIQSSIENVLKDLLLEVEKENPFFKTTLINSGSFYEGTKVGQPDEFDYFVQLDNFSEPTDVLVDELPRSTVIVIPTVSGFTKLKRLICNPFRKYFDSRRDFDWKTDVKAPFVETFNKKAMGFQAYGMRVLDKALQKHGPAYCLELEWTGGNLYRGLKISVDLSLAVKINSRSTTMDLDLETPAGKVIKSLLDSLPYYFAVSTYRDRDFEVPPSKLFEEFREPDSVPDNPHGFRLRCSQSCLEQALFHHFGPNGGPSVCLRVLKVLRDMTFPADLVDLELEGIHVDSGAVNSRNDLDIGSSMLKTVIDLHSFVEKDGKCSKWISSYALKTLVLFEWEQNPTDEQWAGRNLSERFSNILERLERLLSLSHGSGFRSFFYKDYNILPSKEDDPFRSYAVNKITTLHNCILSIRNYDEYKFEDCFQSITEDVKLTCQKMKLTSFLRYALLFVCRHELEEVVARATVPKEIIFPMVKSNFCDIYIQALLGKIAPEERLILIDPRTLKDWETASMSKAIDLFKEIAGIRMKELDNLPSYNLWSQEFKFAGDEIAELLQFLCNIFKKDIEILLNKL